MELLDVARSHGWSLDGIELYELQAAESRLKPDDEYTVFRPEEIELIETMGKYSVLWSGSNRPAPSLTHCPSCACWQGTRSAIGARFSA